MTSGLTFLLTASPLFGQSSVNGGVDCSDPYLRATAACQQSGTPTMPSQGQNGTAMQLGGTATPGLPTTDPTSARLPGNAPVYVDSAGNRWQRMSPDNDRNRYVFPPDPVTDLQKLTKTSTGEAIPIFGRDFFETAPSTFAPADEVPVTPDYVVGPGDEVLVRIWGAEATSSNDQLTVDSSGNIYIPRVGSIQVAGLRAQELQSRLNTEVGRVFRNFHLSVGLGHLRSIQVYVVGEARRPGAYTISSLSTVINALFASGGPNVQGSMRRIQVRRGDHVQSEFDLYDLVLRGDKTHDVRLETGDILYIPAVGPQVALAGSVRHPAIYELKADSSAAQPASSLSDILALAGGLSATGAPGQIRLERIGNDLQRHALAVSLDAAGLAMPLKDGDVLYAGHISPGYEQSVTIRGNLANPGRFTWKAGMRLSDIIPDRNSLLTNDYWRARNRLGVPTPLFQPADANGFPQTQMLPGQQLPYSNTGTNRTNYYNNGNSNYGSNNVRGMGNSAQAPLDSEDGVSLAAGGVVSANAAEMDRTAREEVAGRSVFGSTNSDDAQNTALANSTSRNAAGVNTGPPDATRMAYGNGPQMQQPLETNLNRVQIPAPEIDWSYAVVERLDKNTLKSTLLPFNLGKLVQNHDSSQDLPLQPGDVVTILSQRDILVPQHEQTKYVRLEGEFTGAGVYSVAPGETLDQLVARAGGFTTSAYLYGSSFLRESARAFQQQRLDEYISRLSTDMERNTAVRGASTTTGISDPNALALERNIVNQLRQLRATGRIVLDFGADSSGINSLPRMPLENGDVFRVPSRPNIVSVIGAVYGQNLFLYDSGRKLQDYVLLAGKPNRIADKDHAFIIRANGSIFSRERAKGVFSNHFDEAVIYPGDAIVVPEKPIKPTALRQFVDYSQVLSSFGLAAAAINVVK